MPAVQKPNQNLQAGISLIERRLSGILKPVSPRHEFINGLGQRIQTGSRVKLVNNVANWHIMAILIAGFISLAVLLAMVSRGLLARFGKKPSA